MPHAGYMYLRGGASPPISFKIHTFLSSGTFSVTSGGACEYTLVAGGGGGGYGSPGGGVGGGGGAGSAASYLTGQLSHGQDDTSESSNPDLNEALYGKNTILLTDSTDYTVTVGAGGPKQSGYSGFGGASVFSKSGTTYESRNGGASGGTWSVGIAGNQSGGGGGAFTDGASYSGGGGGGFGNNYSIGGNGASGVWYGVGGGGGGCRGNASGASGGSAAYNDVKNCNNSNTYYGAGGTGSTGWGSQGADGGTNEGDGGGGGHTNSGNGGSGIVVIRYLVSSGIDATGGTITTVTDNGFTDTTLTSLSGGLSGN